MAERGKEFPLSIVIRAVDRATAVIRRVNARVTALTAPVRQFGEKLGALGKEAGFSRVMHGFAGVGHQVRHTIHLFEGLALAAGLSEVAIHHLVERGEDLARTAERIGMSVDALAQLRNAAQKSGVEDLDSSLEQLNKRLGLLHIKSGGLYSLLKKVSPAMLAAMQAAKTPEEALGVIADAMEKLEDPTKRAALANAAFGKAGQPMINFLSQGREEIAKLRKRYLELAGSQKGFAEESIHVGHAMIDVKAGLEGIRMKVVEALGPALKELFEKLAKWLAEHREEIGKWLEEFGKHLPEKIEAAIGAFKALLDIIKPVWDAIGGLKTVAIALAVIFAGKLLWSIYLLSTALATTPFGWVVTAIAGLITVGVLLIHNWDAVKRFIVACWDVIWGTVKIAAEGVAIAFKAMWDGITWVFREGWKEIKAIVDKIMWAVDKVKKAAHAVGEYLGGGSGHSTTVNELVADMQKHGMSRPQAEKYARSQLGLPATAPGTATQARVKVEFANMPKGARVIEEPGGAGVDLTTGYVLGDAGIAP